MPRNILQEQNSPRTNISAYEVLLEVINPSTIFSMYRYLQGQNSSGTNISWDNIIQVYISPYIQ